MKVSARHMEGFKFEVVTDSLVFTSDQSPKYGGEGAGPMPSELFLCSLASCLGQAIAFIAAKKRMELRGLSLDVEGKKNTDSLSYDRIKVRIKSDNDSEELEEVFKTARKYCFVSNTLERGVKVEYSIA